MERVKILIISTLGLHYEGITSVIYNYINAMDREKLEIGFISFDDIEDRLKEKFQELGTIYYVHMRKNELWQYIKDLNKILKNNFDVVHVHGNSGTMAIETILASKYQVRKIIVHCHNTTCDHRVLNFILKIPMDLCATDRIGCSKVAGKWLFGKRKYVILNNAIDINKYHYNQNKRDLFRREFGIGEEFVIGHSGRFSEQKNHSFLIDVFSAYHKIDDKAKLLLLSDGPKLESIKMKVQQLGLSRHVIFAGRRDDASDIYNAMDLFLLPSLWEGLPLVMLEAQANGLPLLVSDKVTQDAKCIQRVFYLNLNQGANTWAIKISEIRERSYERTTNMDIEIRNKGFDINKEADMLKKIYIS